MGGLAGFVEDSVLADLPHGEATSEFQNPGGRLANDPGQVAWVAPPRRA